MKLEDLDANIDSMIDEARERQRGDCEIFTLDALCALRKKVDEMCRLMSDPAGMPARPLRNGESLDGVGVWDTSDVHGRWLCSCSARNSPTRERCGGCKDVRPPATQSIEEIVARVRACVKQGLSASTSDAAAVCDAWESLKSEGDWLREELHKLQRIVDRRNGEHDLTRAKLVDAERARDSALAVLSSIRSNLNHGVSE